MPADVLPVEPSHKERIGLIHVYTGEGKGKTTAALGLALRAIGHGFAVYIVQFLKGGTYIGELAASEILSPRLHIMQYGKDCIHTEKLKSGEKQECGDCRYCFAETVSDQHYAQYAFDRAKRVVRSGLYDMVILDEINVALAKGYVAIPHVLEMMLSKKKETELVLTGRGVPEEIIAAADLVTEMREIKHPMRKGNFGRRGVEY
ncbi:MAG: cob(I)yrinic acid a,c-diamide adenosyltransferase [bacterium]